MGFYVAGTNYAFNVPDSIGTYVTLINNNDEIVGYYQAAGQWGVCARQ
jgi:hypothetical protein